MSSMVEPRIVLPPPTPRRHAARAVGAIGVAGRLIVWAASRRVDIVVGLLVLAVPFSLLERWRPRRRQAPEWRRRGAETGFVVDEVLAA